LTDVARIETIWSGAACEKRRPVPVRRFFSAVDAMFAPVVNRFDAYRLLTEKPQYSRLYGAL
jgi:glutathione S-transferase